MTAAEEIVRSAALRLQTAAESGTPCEPVRDLLGDWDVALAYRVQQCLTTRRVADGARIVGRKVGLTSPVVQRQLGVDQPDLGVLFDDMLCAPGSTVPPGRLLQPKAEAEIAFVLNDDLDGKELNIRTVRAAVAYAVAALEIVDSRIRGWDISITDTVADNASSAMFVLGGTQLTLDEFAPVDVEMSLTKDGVLASTGTGSACLGDPLAALVWLGHAARHYGAPLRAGDVVLAGALGPMVPVKAGTHLCADLGELGQVSVAFG